MTRTRRRPRFSAAAVLSTPAFPAGFYEPDNAPATHDGKPALVRAVDFDHAAMRPYYRDPIRTANTRASWGEEPQRSVFVSRTVIDRLRVERPLLDACELVHGPLRWARTRKPVDYPGGRGGWREGEPCYFLVGLKGRRRVAWVAPTHMGLVPREPRRG